MQFKIKFYADESVEKRIVITLREKYSVVSVDETMKGASDSLVLKRSEESKTVLITADKDFGELVYNGQQLHSGIVLYRLHGLPINAKVAVIIAAIDKYGPDLLHSFTVVTPQNIRIRKRQP